MVTEGITFLKEKPLILTNVNQWRHLPEGGTTYPYNVIKERHLPEGGNTYPNQS